MVKISSNNLKVTINNKVKVRLHNGTVCSLIILPYPKIDKNSISPHSPVGAAILGASCNEKRYFNVNGEPREITILSIG